MSLSERIERLNQEIGSSVERSIAELRQEISQRLRASSEEIQRRIEEIAPRLPAAFLSHDDFAPHEREVGSTARRTAFSEVRDGVAAIDRARSQAEILTALLRESARHSSRAALLLVRGGELRGWGSEGFGDAEGAVRELALSPRDGAWGRLLQGESALHLATADCAELCGRIEAPLPQAGVLIPLVLRDRVAAGLYADRLEDAGLDVEALQVLAHAAALGIETLPFRERAATPTLSLAGGEPAAAAAETAETAPPPAPAEAAPASAPEPEPATAAAAPSPQAPAPEPVSEAHAEPEAELEPEPAAGAPWTVEDEQSAVSLDAADATETTGTTDAADAADDTAPAVPSWDAAGSRYTAELSTDSIAASASSAQESPLSTQRAAASGAMTEDVPRYPRSVEPEAAAPAPQPRDSSPDATVLLQRSALPFSEPAPAAAPPPAPTPTPLRPVPAPEPAPFERPAPAAAGTPEVRPPSGVDGPGWAFATTRVPVSPSDEAMHEEARRLARLLVSEIKLYNEEQVEEGRRNRDIYERLKEDIDRSRQMYDERVDPKILRSTDYFYQELVRILAAGDSRALGI
ncbi:MAG TPA: hypothetical protein VIA62_00395 [Thermoanaerobaculia bacterium]|jgi:hypothetical protein|nr:hypothetical protein [Thermoanaerobaculia bacterium]